MNKTEIMMDNGWARCGKCGHKLFKVSEGASIKGIEIKCHSCKEINVTGELPKVWVFTFGCGQKHAGHYVTFYGTNNEAREKMIAEYGIAWAFQYSEEEFKEYKRRGTATETPLT